MNETTIFEKIIAREIPADIIYDDPLCICFKDLSPQAPIHLLLVPKKPIQRIGDALPEDQDTLGHLMLTAQKIARQEHFHEDGFRIVINNGADGGETVPHLHLHLLAGKRLGWPPC